MIEIHTIKFQGELITAKVPTCSTGSPAASHPEIIRLAQKLNLGCRDRFLAAWLRHVAMLIGHQGLVIYR